jgi:hypothetical protein
MQPVQQAHIVQVMQAVGLDADRPLRWAGAPTPDARRDGLIQA